MPTHPITAQCTRCDNDFYLFEVVDQRSGLCPRCGRILAPDWTPQLLEDARKADDAQRRLVNALRNLRVVPGHAVVRPHTVFRNLFEEVGWQRSLPDDPQLLRSELDQLRELVDRWEELDPGAGAAPTTPPLRRRLRDLFLGRRPARRTVTQPIPPAAVSSH
jgi:hypothetical protein